MTLAPIALFVYNRVQPLKQTIEALQINSLAKESDLFIFSDGPKNSRDGKKVDKVREYIRTIERFKDIKIIERRENLGISNSIITGIEEVLSQYDKIIVLEDDLISSPYFLKFMNDALEFYINEEKVISISGYIYPIKKNLLETFFLKGADCWGWATWRRGWKFFEKNGEKLLQELKEKRLEREFDISDTYPYTNMLKKQVRGLTDSWAIRWQASAFLKDKLTLYPGRSLIRHLGFGLEGSHASDAYRETLDGEVCQTPISVKDIPIEENPIALEFIEEHLKLTQPTLLQRIAEKIKKYFYVPQFK